MNVDPVGFLPSVQEIATGPLQEAEPAAGSGFAAWMTREMGTVNDKMVQSDQLLQRLATGEVDNLHQVMLSIEEAKLSFQLLVQVRNKLLEAYQDILRMQV
jgi:flagellar hook-basal body complex protein FliE